jgi:hypothetical protein
MLIGSGLQALASSGKFKPVILDQIRTAGNTIDRRRPGGLRIPTQSGRVFRFDAGRDSDLKPATIPN